MLVLISLKFPCKLVTTSYGHIGKKGTYPFFNDSENSAIKCKYLSTISKGILWPNYLNLSISSYI